jgi:hypothetical protein
MDAYSHQNLNSFADPRASVTHRRKFFPEQTSAKPNGNGENESSVTENSEEDRDGHRVAIIKDRDIF